MLPSLRFMLSWLAPTRDALFVPSLSWSYRWRLLVLQPIALLTYVLKYLPYVFSRRYSVIGIPTRGKHVLRAIVFKPPGNPSTTARPLHIDFHGGAFIGGMAEYDAPFCELLSDRAGAVVISAQYRYAPAYMYPCAHEDAEDVVDWVLKNVGRWNADPDSLTVSGSSAGGDLMFAAGTRARAAVGFCPVVSRPLELHVYAAASMLKYLRRSIFESHRGRNRSPRALTELTLFLGSCHSSMPMREGLTHYNFRGSMMQG